MGNVPGPDALVVTAHRPSRGLLRIIDCRIFGSDLDVFPTQFSKFFYEGNIISSGIKNKGSDSTPEYSA
jgi:hypothetical protein